MKDIIKGKFNFDYENDSTASYLVLNMNSNQDVLQYQIEMIINNSCPGILKLDARYENNDIKLYYNITSKLTLFDFLQRKKLNKNEFIDILTGITKTLIDSKEYFLYDKNFLIDEDYIFINPSTFEIGMVYIPVDFDTNIDINESFKSFLVNLIISLAKIDEDSKDNYMQKILNYIKDDLFNISDFDKLLRDIKSSKVGINRKDKPQISLMDDEDLNIESSGSNKKVYSNIKSEEEFINKSKQDKGLNTLRSKKERKEDREKISIKKRYKPRYVIIAALVQVVIILFLIFSLNSIKEFVGDDISTYGGITLIIAAIDVLLFKNLFKKENMEEIKITHKDNKSSGFCKNKNLKKKSSDNSDFHKKHQNINMTKREIYNVNECDNIDEGKQQVGAAYEEIDLISDTINETIILDEEKKELPYIQRMNNGIMEKISITKSNFIIGRLPNYVDYLIDNNAVGRTHCEILCREDKYFIKDLNSKNGTFVNENRIDSNSEYELNNNDRVKFADVEYTFKI